MSNQGPQASPAIASYDALGIKSGSFVLDVGFGTGDDLRRMAEIVGPDGLVAGIDEDAAMIQTVMKLGLPDNATISQAPVTLIPFRDGLFDAALTQYPLSQVRDPERAVRELRRVLRSGGRAFLRYVDAEDDLLTRGGFLDVTLSENIIDSAKVISAVGTAP